jgi:hypothetical protein
MTDPHAGELASEQQKAEEELIPRRAIYLPRAMSPQALTQTTPAAGPVKPQGYEQTVSAPGGRAGPSIESRVPRVAPCWAGSAFLPTILKPIAEGSVMPWGRGMRRARTVSGALDRVMLQKMNPLLFADWGRMSRLFTKIMWLIAAILVCVVFAVLASAGRPAHASPAPHATGTAAGAMTGHNSAASDSQGASPSSR